MNQSKKFTYLIICLGCFTISFNIAAITAAVPSIAGTLQENSFLVAKIIPYYLLPYGLAALLFAPLTRYISFSQVYVLIALLFASGNAMCASAQSLNMLLAGRILMGVSAAGMIPLGLMIIGDVFEKQVRGRLVGGFFSNAFIASITGLWIGQHYSWRVLFIVPVFLCAVLIVLVLWKGCATLSFKHKGRINYLHVLSKAATFKIFAFIFVLSACFHAVHKWYGVYLAEVYHLDNFRINFFIMLTVFAGFCGQITGGWLTDKGGRIISCLFGLIGLGLSVMALYREYSLVLLGCVLFLISFFWTVGHNGISTMLTDFPDEDRPVVASLNSSIRFISGGLGFYLSSFGVVQSFSLTFLYIGILIILISTIFKHIITVN